MFLNFTNLPDPNFDLSTISSDSYKIGANTTLKIKLGKINSFSVAYFRIPDNTKVFYLGDQIDLDKTVWNIFYNTENNDVYVDIYKD